MVGHFDELDHPRDAAGRFAGKPTALESLDRLDLPAPCRPTPDVTTYADLRDVVPGLTGDHHIRMPWLADTDFVLVDRFDLASVATPREPWHVELLSDWNPDGQGATERDYADMAVAMRHRPWTVPPLVVTEHADGHLEVLAGADHASLGLGAGSDEHSAYVAVEPAGSDCRSCAFRAQLGHRLGAIPDPVSESDYQTALVELRARLEDTPLRGAAHLRLDRQTVTGADLPSLAFTADQPLDVTRVEPVVTTSHTKPDGGVWLSLHHRDGSTGWQSWMAAAQWPSNPRERAARSSHVEPVTLRADARVLRIDSRDDLIAVADVYPGPEHPGRNTPPFDFKAAARDYDAIWVTRAGMNQNRSTGAHPHLYGWDLESVVVLNPDAIAAAAPSADRTPVSNDHTRRARP